MGVGVGGQTPKSDWRLLLGQSSGAAPTCKASLSLCFSAPLGFIGGLPKRSLHWWTIPSHLSLWKSLQLNNARLLCSSLQERKRYLLTTITAVTPWLILTPFENHYMVPYKLKNTHTKSNNSFKNTNYIFPKYINTEHSILFTFIEATKSSDFHKIVKFFKIYKTVKFTFTKFYQIFIPFHPTLILSLSIFPREIKYNKNNKWYFRIIEEIENFCYIEKKCCLKLELSI